MVTLKGVGIGAGLLTGATGIASAVAYSSGAFDSNIQISQLLKEENKFALLPTTGSTYETEWGTAWTNYKNDNQNAKEGEDKWSLTGWKSDLSAMTADFKKVCSQKSSEGVRDRNDPKYKDITKYCSRPKSLKEVLDQEGIANLLATTNQVSAWTTKYNSYQRSTNNKFPADSSNPINDNTKLSKACETATTLKTNNPKYEQTYEAFRAWCLV